MEKVWTEKTQTAIERVVSCFRKNFSATLNDMMYEEARKRRVVDLQDETVPSSPVGSPLSSGEVLTETEKKLLAIRDAQESKNEQPSMESKTSSFGANNDTRVVLLPRQNPFSKPRPREALRAMLARVQQSQHVVFVSILGHEVLQEDTHPYVGYVITSRFRDHEATVIRRYNEFKKLNKSLGKTVPSSAIFPPGNGSIGKRNFTPSFIAERSNLLEVYIKELGFCDTTASSKALHEFLGLKENPDLIELVLQRALKRTQSDLGLMKPIYGNSPVSALTELIQRELDRSVGSALTLDSQRDVLNKIVPKKVVETLEKMLHEAAEKEWKSTVAQFPKQEACVRELLERYFDAYSSAVVDTRQKLAALLKPRVDPHIRRSEIMVQHILQRLIPGVAKPLRLVLLSLVDTLPTIQKGFESCDRIVLQRAMSSFSEVTNDVMRMLEITMSEACVSAVSDIASLSMVEEAKDLLGPVKKLSNILRMLFEFLDPRPYSDVFNKILSYQEDLSRCPPESRLSLLDKLEADFDFRLGWYGWDITMKGRSLRRNLSEETLEDSLLGELFTDTWDDFEHKLYRSFMKRFLFHASDWCWAAWNIDEKDTMKSTAESLAPPGIDPNSLVVKEAFQKGLIDACNDAREILLKVLKRFTVQFFSAPLVNSISTTVLKGLDQRFADIQWNVPEYKGDLLGVGSIASRMISEMVEEMVTRVVMSERDHFFEAINYSSLHP